MLKIILFLIFFIIDSPLVLATSNEHQVCKKKDECEIIGSSGDCCGSDLAINKKFSSLYKKPVNKECYEMKVKCPKVEVECQNNICKLIYTKID